MKSTRIAMAIVVLALTAAPAHADWNYVKWGMTKQAAIDASKGEARPATRPNVVCVFTSQVPFATIPRKLVAGFTFQVTFCTEGADKVTSVALSPSEGTDLPALRGALVSQYGQPTVVNGTDTWNDRKAGNTISYSEIGGVVARIEYKKMGGAGL
jgi:hypothetical protein